MVSFVISLVALVLVTFFMESLWRMCSVLMTALRLQ